LAPSFLTREADGAEWRFRAAYRETTAELRDLTASGTSSIRALQRGRTHRAQRALNPGPDLKRPKAGAESTRQSRPAFDLPTFSPGKCGTRWEVLTNFSMTVRIFGNTAVVTGSDTEKSMENGKDTTGKYVWTDVFVKQNGKWRAVTSQSTKLPK
jgi:hypothetical protein